MSKMKRMKDVTVGIVLGGVLFSGVSYAASTSIEVNFQSLKYFFDGVEKKAPSDQQGFIYKGTTYVPLRFVSEALGKKVGYEGKTSSIYVGKQPEGQKTFLEDMKTLTLGTSWNYISTNDFVSNTGEKYSHAQYNGKGSDGTITAEYLLNADYKKFEALLAPEKYWNSKPTENNIGSLKIYVDEKLVYESGTISSDLITPKKINVDLSGALKIKLVFESYHLGLLDSGFIS